MKKTLAFILALVFVFSTIPAVFAEDETTPADDPVISELAVASSLQFNGTTAICSATITEPNKYIVATMTLSCGGTPVGSWGGSDWSVVYLYGTCNAVKGQTYTLVISGTVDGVPFSTTPYSKTC